MKLRLIRESEYDELEDADEFGDEEDFRNNPCPECDHGELEYCHVCTTVGCYTIEDNWDNCITQNRPFNLAECEVCNEFVCEKCRVGMPNGTVSCRECLKEIPIDSPCFTESEYDELEDADEFVDPPNAYLQSNYGPVTVGGGEYIFRAYALYERDNRDINQMVMFHGIVILINGKRLTKILADKVPTHRIEAAILAEYPEYDKMLNVPYPLVWDTIQDLCFKHYEGTGVPDPALW